MNQHLVLELDAKRDVQPETGTLRLRCQSPADQAILRKLCEPDRAPKLFVMRYVDANTAVFEPAPKDAALTTKAPNAGADAAAKEKARLTAMDPKELKTLAGELQVKWDEKASPETMIERLVGRLLAKKS